jgi:hypothetical protein
MDIIMPGSWHIRPTIGFVVMNVVAGPNGRRDTSAIGRFYWGIWNF